jgi:cyclin T
MAAVADNTSSTSTSSTFDISQLPSLKKGMSATEEATKRRKTCRFIEEAGRVLKLPRVAISTAMVFFHRFYAKHAFQEHDRFEVAVAALVLAAKTEEAPKKLNTVIQECYKLKTRAMQAGRLSQNPGASPKGESSSSSYLDTKGEEFLKLKERILLLERIILHTIGFELSIDHPYKFFVEQIKKLIHTRQLRYSPSKASSDANKHKTNTEIMQKMMNELVQYSMSTANDSYQTSLCLQFGPKQIATSCVYLACMFSDVEPQNGDWKRTLLSNNNIDGSSGETNTNDSFGYDVEALVSVCVQVIDLIADKKASDSESVRKIRKALELLKNNSSNSNSAASAPRRPPPPPSGESNKRPRV